MIEFLQNFHFLRPWLLLFLLLPFALYLRKTKFFALLSSWEDVCDKNLLDFLLVRNNNLKSLSIKKLIYTALIVTTLAAAGPSWKKEELPVFAIENPNMFILSLAQDMQLKDISPSRLERAKFMLSDIIDNLVDGQFGIEVYSNEPYILTPITDDVRLIKSLLPQIVPNIMPDQGDRLDRAIDLALERFKSAGYSSGNIILFASDVGQRFDLALEKAKANVNENYYLHVVDASYSGSDKLKLLANAGNGVYLKVTELSPNKLLEKINSLNKEHTILTENLRSNYIDYGYYLVFVSLFCILFLFRKGLLILVLCCFTTQAQAGFLQNNNQEGFSLFKNGAYDKAVEKFTDFNWKGIAFYKQDKLDDALAEFSKQPQDVISLYNKGVVLVKLCKYEEALKTFDDVLTINPQFADALYNRQVLTDLFEKAKDNPDVLSCGENQQQQQPNSQQEQNNNDNNQSNSEQNQQNSDDTQSDSQNQNPKDDKSSENQPDETKQQTSSNAKDEQSSKDNNNNETAQNSDEQPSNSENTSAEKNNENSEQNNNNQSDSDDVKNKQETQSMKQNSSIVNAKEGSDDEKYDEEALAMQRRYREIPEDAGGLLREFIKKEYLKDRYKNENM